MKRINIQASRSYDILIGEYIIDQLGTLIAQWERPDKIACVTDSTVNEIFGGKVEKSLAAEGFQVFKYVFPSGEGSKNMEHLERILEFWAENALTRTDMVLALGGGVAGDMAGFASAVYLRGVEYIQVPTTFLAAVDSSVGGKTAVDLKAGKNLAGSFWQPSLVLCDTSVIAGLPDRVFLDGVAECLKYGILADPELFDRIGAEGCRMKLEDTIARCVEIKRDVVMADEYDRGQRQLLNLGHTAGHAIERLSGYQISHGRAVAIGMVVAAKAAERLRLTEEACGDKIKWTIAKTGLPVDCPYSPRELAQAALSDKKRTGKEITLVIPKRIGRCELYKIPIEELEGFFTAGIS